MYLISYCDLDSFSWLLLWWLLPFILGLLLGYLIWYSWKRKFEEGVRELNSRETRILELERSLEECERDHGQASNEVIFLRAQLRELRRQYETSGEKNRSEKTGRGPGDLTVTGKTASIYKNLDQSNLQIFEGIGPKMEAILKEKGIRSWVDLAERSVEDLQSLLDSYGGKYRIIDPGTWPIQAGMAADGNWDDLILFQKTMNGEQEGTNRQSKIEKILVKLGVLRQWEKDDLLAIEGIGPKTDLLLRSKGITSWTALSTTSVETLQRILDQAGDKFRLSDPKTWPEQARLAASERWDELERLQEGLTGGKKTTGKDQ